MPIRYRIFPESQILVTRYIGHVTETELLDVYREIFDLEDYDACRVELVDVRQKTVSDYTMATFMTLNEMTIERFGPTAEGLVTAVLARENSDMGMANLYRAVTDIFGPEEVATFVTVQDALEWLKVPHAGRRHVTDWLASPVHT